MATLDLGAIRFCVFCSESTAGLHRSRGHLWTSAQSSCACSPAETRLDSAEAEGISGPRRDNLDFTATETGLERAEAEGISGPRRSTRVHALQWQQDWTAPKQRASLYLGAILYCMIVAGTRLDRAGAKGISAPRRDTLVCDLQRKRGWAAPKQRASLNLDAIHLCILIPDLSVRLLSMF